MFVCGRVMCVGMLICDCEREEYVYERVGVVSMDENTRKRETQ